MKRIDGWLPFLAVGVIVSVWNRFVVLQQSCSEQEFRSIG